MSRYIDADALCEKWLCLQEHDFSPSSFVYSIDNAPTVDAVQVVRCEKCRHGIKAHGISDGWVLCSKPYVTDTVGNMMHRCDWFCADGERRSDGKQ